MPKTITLTQVKIDKVIVDVDRQRVVVLYALEDAASQSWIRQEATFWVTMPPQVPIYDADGVTVIGYQDYPDTWFQLPAMYVSALNNMVKDAKTALENRFLS